MYWHKLIQTQFMKSIYHDNLSTIERIHMEWLNKIIDLFDAPMIIVFIVIGLFSIFIDAREFANMEKMREYNISKRMGFVYIVLGIAIFIFNQIFYF